MAGFEPGSCGFGSNLSANCATTTGLTVNLSLQSITKTFPRNILIVFLHMKRIKSQAVIILWDAKCPAKVYLSEVQCDQMARSYFNIWLFTSIKIYQIAFKICQSRFKILPKTK